MCVSFEVVFVCGVVSVCEDGELFFVVCCVYVL